MSEYKVCAHCGAQNEPQAKYCQNCGAQLAKKKNRICPHCQTKNDLTARFCKNCGQPLTKAKHPSKQGISKSKAPLLLLAGLLGFFILFIFVKSVQTPSAEHSHNTPADLEVTSGDVALEATVNQIASLFWCSCGSCNDSLEKCACQTAQKERNFIRKQVEKKIDQNEIVQAVKQKYGLLKSDFKDFNAGG